MNSKGVFPISKWNFESESIFEHLPEEIMAFLYARMHEQSYKKGEIVFKEGAYPTGIFYILEGKVKKYKVDKEQREQIIYVANAGELVGYHAILAEEYFPDSAATLEKSKIAFIPKEDFFQALSDSPLLNRRLLKTLSHEFSVLANSITMFAQKTVRERLALQLIILREKYKPDTKPGMPVEINMSRDDLASLVGTARENVVRILSEFKQSGLIETKGRIIIVRDMDKLITISS